MRFFKIWPMALSAGLMTALVWAVYRLVYGPVPAVVWNYNPSFNQEVITLSRWYDIPAIMVLVYVFAKLMQRLFRHLTTKASIISGILLAGFVYTENAMRLSWYIDDTLTFVVTSASLMGAIMGLLLGTPRSLPMFLSFLFGLSLIGGMFSGFVNGTPEFFFGATAGAIGLTIGFFARSAIGFLYKPLYLRFWARSNSNRQS